jgi:ADP-ribosylglycohydrolase
MLLNMAIGDAYGAGFEFRNNSLVTKFNTGESYLSHQKSRIAFGHYTDDTQMALALCEVILEGTDWTPENIAQKFVDVFHRDQRQGYAHGFYNFLKHTKTGKEFTKNIQPWSSKSGGAMRSAPLGVFPDLDEVKEKTIIQASITHNTTDGKASALAVALSSHYFLYNLGIKKELPNFLDSHIAGCNWSKKWSGEVSVLGMDCVQAALSAIQENDNLKDILIQCVSFGGDTDTVCCIAMGIATHSQEIEDNLPDSLFTGLENGQYGRDYLSQIDSDLVKKFSKGQVLLNRPEG